MTGRSHALDLVPGLRELARRQLGVVHRDQLRELGVRPHHVAQQIAAQRWTAYGRCTVVLSTGVLTRDQRRAVAVIHAGPRAALGGLTSLETLGLRDWWRDALHVLVPQGGAPSRLPGVVAHQTRHLDDADLVPGMWPPCTTAARAAIDAATWERHPRTASGIVLATVQQRLAIAQELLDELERRGPVRHKALLRRVLHEAAAGADALSEIDMVGLIRSLGLPEPRRQVFVSTPDGSWYVDLVVELPDGRRLAIEVDGPSHLDPRVREEDARKDLALTAAGYIVVRIPVAMLTHDPAGVRSRLLAVVRGAGRVA